MKKVSLWCQRCQHGILAYKKTTEEKQVGEETKVYTHINYDNQVLFPGDECPHCLERDKFLDEDAQEIGVLRDHIEFQEDHIRRGEFLKKERDRKATKGQKGINEVKRELKAEYDSKIAEMQDQINSLLLSRKSEKKPIEKPKKKAAKKVAKSVIEELEEVENAS